jgi:probable F420-dependent oxidoreductase
MKLDAVLPPLDLVSVTETARAAEALGFSALWSAETKHDPFLPLALAAEHTTRMALGTAIAVSFARSPTTLAHTAWDLARLSQGRFILGLGTQVRAHVERRFGMQWPDSVTAKLREQMLAIRALWDCWQHGTKLNFRGEYYKLTLMSPFFEPPPLPASVFGEDGGGSGGGIPIYIAGVNLGLAKLAGELCGGYHIHPLNSPRYLRECLLPAIEEGLATSARSRHAFTICASAFIALGHGQREFARQQIAFYASTPSYRPVMDLHGWSETAERLSLHAARSEWAELPGLITDEMLSAFCTLADSPAELAANLKLRYAGLADRILPYLPFVPGEYDDLWNGMITVFAEEA